MRTFTRQFFEALGDSAETARSLLRDAAYENGVDAEPSPRAADIVDRGEWDSHAMLGLELIGRDACFHKLGSMKETAFPSAPSLTRFCGKPNCTLATHAKAWLPENERRPGWYVDCGSLNGVIKELRFPTAEEGGPIANTNAMLALTDAADPFQMSIGQWTFLHGYWAEESPESLASSVSDVSEAASGRASRPPDVETVDEESNPEVEGSGTEPLSSEARAFFKTTLRGPSFSTADTPTMALAPPRKSPEEAEAPSVGGFLERIIQMNPPNEEEASNMFRQFANKLDAHLSTQAMELVRLQSVQAVTLKRLEKVEYADVELGAVKSRLTVVEGQNIKLQAELDHLRGIEQTTETLRHNMLDNSGRVPVLWRELKVLKGRVDSAGIKVHGVKFNDASAYLAWAKKNDLPVGIMVDAISGLQTVHAPYVPQSDATKARADQAKVGFKTPLEAAIATSFDSIIPGILGGGKVSDVSSTLAVLQAALLKYEDFDPPGGTEGVMARMNSGIKSAEAQITEMLREVTDDPEVIALAQGITRDSVHFIAECTHFVCTQNKEYTADSSRSKDQVWKMQLECLAIMLEELSKARGMIRTAASFEPRLLDYGQLKGWQVQQRYLKNNFRDDPMFTGVLVRRLLMHGDDKTLKKRLDSLESFQNKYNDQHRKDQAEVKKIAADLKKHVEKPSH